jgi:hypothetical protein
LAAFRRPPESCDGQETGQQHVGDVSNVAIAAATAMTPLERLIRIRYDYSDAWIAFRNALAEGSGTLELPIDRELFLTYAAARRSSPASPGCANS